MGTPSWAARRAWVSERSRRSGELLISMALPWARAAANTASMSTSYGSREPIKRPVGCARMSTCGFPSALTVPAVISGRDCLNRARAPRGAARPRAAPSPPPAVRAKRGRDPAEPARGVHVLLGGPGQARARGLVEHAVLAHPQPAPDGDLAHSDVVVLRAREVLER